MLKAIAKKQGRSLLAIDGMQLEVGLEVGKFLDCLQGRRYCLSVYLLVRNSTIEERDRPNSRGINPLAAKSNRSPSR